MRRQRFLIALPWCVTREATDTVKQRIATANGLRIDTFFRNGSRGGQKMDERFDLLFRPFGRLGGEVGHFVSPGVRERLLKRFAVRG